MFQREGYVRNDSSTLEKKNMHSFKEERDTEVKESWDRERGWREERDGEKREGRRERERSWEREREGEREETERERGGEKREERREGEKWREVEREREREREGGSELDTSPCSKWKSRHEPWPSPLKMLKQPSGRPLNWMRRTTMDAYTTNAHHVSFSSDSTSL